MDCLISNMDCLISNMDCLILDILPIEVNLEISPVRIKTGAPKNGGTLSSMRLWVRMKLMLLSGRDLVSLVQVPGLGSGTL